MDAYEILRFRHNCSIHLQRIWRGFAARKKTAKRMLWKRTKPGADRIKLGINLIEHSQRAFERQRGEIDALHRAQEKAETQISKIYKDLKDHEQELIVLERELRDIDDTYSSDEVSVGGNSHLVQSSETTPITEVVMGDALCRGRELCESKENVLLKLAQTFEHQNKKRLVESEVQFVLSEVEDKRKALKQLEAHILEIEEVRSQKDREFVRLQRDLIELLSEQKEELDELRQKGIELETATATSAAVAVETAEKARQHEVQTNKIFDQHEELMKFQFMSMSLSYFSSLNMLKQMRNVTADATASAVRGTAAAAAAAANIPLTLPALDASHSSSAGIKSLGDVIDTKESEKGQIIQSVSDYKLPPDCCSWTIDEVGMWLRSLSLGAYVGVRTRV